MNKLLILVVTLFKIPFVMRLCFLKMKMCVGLSSCCIVVIITALD